jgi:hypothetical protein
LTSLNSAAYLALVSGFGPRARNRADFRSRNGLTLPTHALGSLIIAGGVGCHSPGAVPTGNRKLAKRPSFSRAASILAAVAAPTVMPPSLARPCGTLASDVAYSASSAGCCAGNSADSTR